MMNVSAKITKKDNYAELRECVMDHMDWFEDGVATRLIEFIDHEVELLDKRAEDAKKYAKKSQKATDAMATNIMEVLMDANGELMTIPDIVNKMSPELEATPQKITYRLSTMIKSGDVVKESVSIKEEGKNARKVNAYRLTTDTDVTSDEE